MYQTTHMDRQKCLKWVFIPFEASSQQKKIYGKEKQRKIAVTTTNTHDLLNSRSMRAHHINPTNLLPSCERGMDEAAMPIVMQLFITINKLQSCICKTIFFLNFFCFFFHSEFFASQCMCECGYESLSVNLLACALLILHIFQFYSLLSSLSAFITSRSVIMLVKGD